MPAMSSGPEPSTPRILAPVRPLVVRTTDGHHRQATWLELFFDLCFVVAIAALARAFHGDPTWEGAATFVGLFVPVWWARVRCHARERSPGVARSADLSPSGRIDTLRGYG